MTPAWTGEPACGPRGRTILKIMVPLWALLFSLVLSSRCGAQSQSRAQFDSVQMTPALQAVLEKGREGNYCAPLGAWRRYPERYSVYFDSLVVAEARYEAAECDPRAATVIVRAVWGFSVVDFVFLRPRAHYVALISPPYAVGIPLGRFPGVQSTEVGLPVEGWHSTAGGALGLQDGLRDAGKPRSTRGSLSGAFSARTGKIRLWRDAGSIPARGYHSPPERTVVRTHGKVAGSVREAGR